MRRLLFLSAAVVVTGCVEFGGEDAPTASNEAAPTVDTPPSEAVPATPPPAGCPPATTPPQACAFAETFEDESFTSRWTAVAGVKGDAKRVVENGNGFLRVTAPDDDTLFFARTILDDDSARVLRVRGRIRVVKASVKGEVDVFRVVSAVPTASTPVAAAASIVRPYRGGVLVAETMINENGDGPEPLELGTDGAAAWTDASIRIDRVAGIVTIALGNEAPTTQPMPPRMATGGLALQIGAAYNGGAAAWIVDLDDVCVNVVR